MTVKAVEELWPFEQERADETAAELRAQLAALEPLTEQFARAQQRVGAEPAAPDDSEQGSKSKSEAEARRAREPEMELDEDDYVQLKDSAARLW